MNIKLLFSNSRFYILSSSTLLAFLIFTYINKTIPGHTFQIIKLTQIYALISIVYLYIAILATPLTKIFPSFPFRKQYIFMRRAIGVSAFLFALLHGLFSFFGELGGFVGLGFLDSHYLLATGAGSISLLILTLMTLTSFDFIIGKLTFPKWKLLHRFVYLAGILTLIHALMLGSHFTNLSNLIPQILEVALAVLIILEAIRLDKYLIKFGSQPKVGYSLLFVLVLLAVSFSYLLQSSSSSTSLFNIHSAHIQLAKQAQLGQNGVQNIKNISKGATNPGLIGDPTRRFTVSFHHPDSIESKKDTNLQFEIFDASNGNPVQLYGFVYSKVMHLIIVDEELNYFNHIHPDQKNSDFEITTQFPHPGKYHLYADFQPLGAIEQQFGFTLEVGGNSQITSPTPVPNTEDYATTKTFAQYLVTLTPSRTPLKASELSIGNQTLKFTIHDATTHQPITNLKPYLAAFGHLVLLNKTTYDYIHVHPANLFPPTPDANGGPEVEFLPLGLYGPIKPGIYRVFAQFNPDNKLLLADFTIKIE